MIHTYIHIYKAIHIYIHTQIKTFRYYCTHMHITYITHTYMVTLARQFTGVPSSHDLVWQVSSEFWIFGFWVLGCGILKIRILDCVGNINFIRYNLSKVFSFSNNFNCSVIIYRISSYSFRP